MDWKKEYVTKAHNLIFRRYDEKLVSVSSDPPKSPYWFLQNSITYDMEFCDNGIPFRCFLDYSSSGGKNDKEAFEEFLKKYSGLDIKWTDEACFKLGTITFEHDFKTGKVSLTPITKTINNGIKYWQDT